MRSFAPSRLNMPLRDHLINHADHWRDQALYTGRHLINQPDHARAPHDHNHPPAVSWCLGSMRQVHYLLVHT